MNIDTASIAVYSEHPRPKPISVGREQGNWLAELKDFELFGIISQ